ncbi:MAG: flagellar biosynthesis protein FlhF [bacterium]
MKIRRYVAPCLEEAVDRVKRELGRDAIILEVRRVRAPGFWGWLKRRRIEVTAAVAQPALPTTPVRKITVPEQSTLPSRSYAEPVVTSTTVAENMMPERLRTPYALARSQTELLVRRGVQPELARQVVEQAMAALSAEELSNSEALARSINRVIVNFFVPQNQVGLTRRVVAFVGPTGVGKTTTIAKLAAVYRLQQGKEVALMTTDTYRIAAVEQLRRYADILHVPLEVVYTAADLQTALDRHQEAEVILVDTAGRSPQQGLYLAELRNLLAGIPGVQTVLVVSATTKTEDLELIFDRFRIFSPSELVFTKVDETESTGTLLNLVNRMRVPVGFVTNGQNVPDDLKIANPQLLADLVLGGDHHA